MHDQCRIQGAVGAAALPYWPPIFFSTSLLTTFIHRYLVPPRDGDKVIIKLKLQFRIRRTNFIRLRHASLLLHILR